MCEEPPCIVFSFLVIYTLIPYFQKSVPTRSSQGQITLEDIPDWCSAQSAPAAPVIAGAKNALAGICAIFKRHGADPEFPAAAADFV